VLKANSSSPAENAPGPAACGRGSFSIKRFDRDGKRARIHPPGVYPAQTQMRAFKIIALVGGMVCLGILLGWWGSRSPDAPAPRVVPEPEATIPPAPRESTQVPPAIVRSAPQSAPVESPPSPAPPIVPVATNGVALIATNAANTTNVVTDWEERLDAILTAETEEPAKANELVQLFPRLPEEGKIEVALHLSNLLEDEDFLPFGRYLLDASQPEEVLEVLMTDVLNRPDSIKLPLLLDVARMPEHPNAEEARDLLELYLEEDYGENWDVWRAKMEEYLRENPD
jgi:hypothetical protein